jgi:exodeoxyribonuclease VII large subunit
LESFNLSTLNLYIRRVIALNFQDPVWVFAELLSVKEKNGHVYLELTEKDALNNITAQNSAVVWKNTYSSLQKSSPFDISHILREGNEVRLLVAIDYNVRYGLKLIVQNIDSEFTFGKIALSRARAIERLKLEGLWQKNKSTPFPLVIKNIAIIGSKESAGYKDFENHLKDNAYQFLFCCDLYNVSVQGVNAIEEISNAFKQLERRKKQYDLIVLIRGGGSKHDLLEFDSFEIAKAISQSNIPVLTGIGHFIDESVADLSAYQSLKTPTAVADYIISVNSESELRTMKLLESIFQLTRQLMFDASYSIVDLYNEMISNSKLQIYDNQRQLTELNFIIRQKSQTLSFNEYKKLFLCNAVLESNDPELILQKGYSLSYIDGTLISKLNAIPAGSKINTKFARGTLTSTVDKTWELKK